MAGAKMTRVLIVDDSALMRKHLTGLFSADAGFEAHVARNGAEAVELIDRVEPDVITLDINMPEMDGLTALSHIMAHRPTPVVMVSSLTEQGAMATLEAMAMGAVDFIPKPGGTISLSIEQVRSTLLEKVRCAARARVGGGAGGIAARPLPRRRAAAGAAQAQLATVQPVARAFGLALIGVSTGGPRALEDVLPRLPAHYPWPVLVAQHMPASFTAAFSQRMAGLCPLQVVEVTRPTLLEPGHIYIARGSADMVVGERVGRLYAIPRPEDPSQLWHPSVELLVRSALEHCPGERLMGVMLTGMGYDGADAMAELRRRGGHTIAESEQSAVVFGMPNELIRRGGAEQVLPITAVAEQMIKWLM